MINHDEIITDTIAIASVSALMREKRVSKQLCSKNIEELLDFQCNAMHLFFLDCFFVFFFFFFSFYIRCCNVIIRLIFAFDYIFSIWFCQINTSTRTSISLSPLMQLPLLQFFVFCFCCVLGTILNIMCIYLVSISIWVPKIFCFAFFSFFFFLFVFNFLFDKKLDLPYDSRLHFSWSFEIYIFVELYVCFFYLSIFPLLICNIFLLEF